VIKSWKMRWTVDVIRTKFWSGNVKLETVTSPRHMYEDNIKINFREIISRSVN